EQERKHVPAGISRRVTARSPADDVQFVHVADAVYITACIEQCSRDVEMSVGGGPVQRVSVVSGLARIWIRAVFEEQPNGIRVAVLSCGVQSCPTALVCASKTWIVS